MATEGIVIHERTKVTDSLAVKLTVPTIQVPDYEAICGAARASADRFIGRDTAQIARFSGLSEPVVRSLHSNRDDLIPSHAKVALIAFGGRAIGRTFEQVADFLSPICEAAGSDFAPRLPIVGTVGVQNATVASLRESTEAIARAMEAVKDGRITSRECGEIERECNQAITELHRLVREAQAAVREVIPIRGKKS